jgi:hypothetical protein
MSSDGPKSSWADGAQSVGKTVLRGVVMVIAVRAAEFALDQIAKGGKAVWAWMFGGKSSAGKPDSSAKTGGNGAKAEAPHGRKKGTQKEAAAKEEPVEQMAN